MQFPNLNKEYYEAYQIAEPVSARELQPPAHVVGQATMEFYARVIKLKREMFQHREPNMDEFKRLYKKVQEEINDHGK